MLYYSSIIRIHLRQSNLNLHHLHTCRSDKLSLLTSFANNKLVVAKMMFSLYDRVENTVGKGENAAYSIFSKFLTVFSKTIFLRLVKVRTVRYRQTFIACNKHAMVKLNGS